MTILKDQQNSRKQGAVGIGACIAWLSAQGHIVSIPMTDSQRYDIIVEISSKLCKIEVKTSTQVNQYGRYVVALRTCGGNKSGQIIKKFDYKEVDYVFLFLDNGDKYFIPSKAVKGKTTITLGKDYQRYKV